jgi:hypothetical protein
MKPRFFMHSIFSCKDYSNHPLATPSIISCIYEESQKEDYSSLKTYKWMFLVSFGNYKKLQRRKKNYVKKKGKKKGRKT